MKTGLQITTVALLTSLACSAAKVYAQESQAHESHGELFSDTLVNVYQPSHQLFENATQLLVGTMQVACDAPSATALAELQARYSALIVAFSSIELYRVGPMMLDNRAYRLFYWPDKRRVGERQLRKLLMSPEAQTIDETQIAQKSVALQGLPALERLLYGSEASHAMVTQECVVAEAIAANIHAIAGDLMGAWTSGTTFTKNLLNPEAEEGEFRTEDEVLRSLVTQLIAGMDVVYEKKLLPLTDDKASIRKGPLWRSGHTLTMIEYNLKSLQALLFDGGLIGQTRLADELSFEFRNAMSLLERLHTLQQINDASGQLTEEALSLLKTLSSIVLSIKTTLGERFTAQVGVSAGFNSGDGD